MAAPAMYSRGMSVPPKRASLRSATTLSIIPPASRTDVTPCESSAGTIQRSIWAWASISPGMIQRPSTRRTSAPRGMPTTSGGPAASICPLDTMTRASRMGGIPVPFHSVPPAYTVFPAPELQAVVVMMSTDANLTARVVITGCVMRV